MAPAGLAAARGREVRLSADAAERLSVASGAVVELVNPRGAPLRAWVADLAAPRTATDGTPLAEVAPIALRMLDVADDAEVELRAVHTGVLTAE